VRGVGVIVERRAGEASVLSTCCTSAIRRLDNVKDKERLLGVALDESGCTNIISFDANFVLVTRD
jgi:hypothetical protein